MTDLTEQWKKGKLPSACYYVKNEFGNIFPSDYSEDYDYISDTVIKDFFTEVSEIKEVIEPVPSYKKWQEYKDANDSMFDTIKMLNKDNYKLEKENAQLKSKLQLKETAYNFDTARLEEENTKLKELLKDCVDLMDGTIAVHIDVYRQRKKDVLNAINQVLGE